MKAYEKQRKKRTTTCSYCGGTGHLWVSCSLPRKHAFQADEGQAIDPNDLQGVHRVRAKKINPDTGLMEARATWLAERALDVFADQTAKKYAKKKKTARKKSKPSRRCGFCKSPSHNRKNCALMHKLRKDLATANQNYRKHFFDLLVAYHGIAEGALMMIRQCGRRANGRIEKKVAIVERIDWDSINLTLSCDNPDYCGDFSVSVVVDGKSLTSSTPFYYWLEEEFSYPTNLKKCIAQNTYDDTFQFLEVVSQSTAKPSEKWFHEGYDNCWNWITKNKKLSDLGCLINLIEQWHPKKDKALKARLKRYRKK